MNQYIDPPRLHQPMGYTHVVQAGPGRTIYVSGQIALDAQGQLVGEGDLGAQTRQVFRNLTEALAGARAGLRDVVKLTIFLTDVSRIQDFRDARNEFMSAPLPSASLVQVAALARPDLLIEIEAVAVVPH